MCLEPNDKVDINNAALRLSCTLFGKSSYTEKSNVAYEPREMLIRLIAKYIAEPYLKGK